MKSSKDKQKSDWHLFSLLLHKINSVFGV